MVVVVAVFAFSRVWWWQPLLFFFSLSFLGFQEAQSHLLPWKYFQAVIA